MKRIGDANEKPFEKVPRRQEPRGDDVGQDEPPEEFLYQQMMQLAAVDFGFRDINPLEEGNDNDGDCETTESTEDLFTYELLMKARTKTNPFGVFCLFALKEIGLDMDVISLIIPSVHLHSLWRLELEQLERMQTKRLKRTANCEKDGIIAVEQEELEEIEKEASSIHLMSFLLGDFGFNCEYTQRYWSLLSKYFSEESPFVHTIHNAVGWSVAQVFIEARHACKKEVERNRMSMNFVFELLKAMPETRRVIVEMAAKNGPDTFFLYVMADVMESLLSFCIQLRETGIMEEKQMMELLAEPECSNYILGIFFPEYSEYIVENQSKTDIVQLLHCVSTMADFLGPVWLVNHLELLSGYCDIAFDGLVEKCVDGDEGVSCDLVHALARGFKHVLPYYVAVGNRELVEELVQFILIVLLPTDEFSNARQALVDLLIDVMRLEQSHPELCLVDFEGRLLYVSEYLPLQSDVEYKENMQTWLLPSEEESAKKLELKAKLALSIVKLHELTTENQELARARRDGKRKGTA